MNMKAIFAEMNTTWTVVKIRPDKNSGQYRIYNHDPCNAAVPVSPRPEYLIPGPIFTSDQIVFIAAKIAFKFTS